MRILHREMLPVASSIISVAALSALVVRIQTFVNLKDLLRDGLLLIIVSSRRDQRRGRRSRAVILGILYTTKSKARGPLDREVRIGFAQHVIRFVPASS